MRKSPMMLTWLGGLLAAGLLGGKLLMAKAEKGDDAYLWLEEVEGAKALDWVRGQNDRSLSRIKAYPEFKQFKNDALAILQAKDKIPMGRIQGEFVYNFWQDAEHVRGLWRRSPWQSYVQGKPEWETLLDVDALAKAEGKSYVFGGADCREPQYDRCIIRLSEGGSDASLLREFDLASKSFVKDGFSLPPSKSGLDWLDKDTLLFADALEKGTQTDSGYPLVMKVWKRGQAVSASTKLFQGNKEDVSVSGIVVRDQGEQHVFLTRALSFFTSEMYYLKGERQIKIALPEDIQFHGVFQGQVLLTNRSDLGKFAAGSLLAVPLNSLLEGKTPFELVFAPNDKQAVASVARGRDFVYVSILDKVRSRVLRFERKGEGQWLTEQLPLDDKGTIRTVSVDEDSNRLFMTYEDFLTPPSLFALDGKALQKTLVKQLPARFAQEGLEIQQKFAKSKDGTEVPYFLVHKKGLALKGSNPTLLYGYGGFEVSMQPSYSGVAGKLWLEKGGVYVLANIRGGGEFGPRWHQAALQAQRQKAFDDFAAVAEDLIATKVTSPRYLGIQGGSNGGLLMGATFTQRPELFEAVICQVPLLDMLRFHKLLAGASWVAEYGSADDPKMEPIIRGYSPFQNLSASKKYPEVFFVTSTKDDRVHPGHARKMAARMQDLEKPFLYYENIEGGHGGSANLQQLAERSALEYSYLWMKLAPTSKTASR